METLKFEDLAVKKFFPFKHIKTFFLQNVLTFFLQYLWKMHLIPIHDFFHKNMHIIKRKKCLTARSSICSVSAKLCPMLVETSYSGEVINPKTYLNHELGSKFFFLSSLAYELVNLFFLEIFHEKWERTDFFFKYWSGTQLYLWFWSPL